MKKLHGLFDGVSPQLIILFMLLAGSAEAATFSQHGQLLTVQHGDYQLQYNLARGTGSLLWQKTRLINTFHSEAALNGITPLLDSQKAAVRSASWQTVKDKNRGNGEKLTVDNQFADGKKMSVSFWFYDASPWLLVDMQVAAAQNVEVTKLTPVTAQFADIAPGSDKRIYTTPYSNNFDFGVAPVNAFGLSQNGTDRFANPQEPMVKFNGISHWVTALFDNTRHQGLVAGAATVQNWKSSQQLGEATRKNGPLSQFSLYNWGGMQQGKQVSSDLFFIGYFTDYRTGLETYGKAYNQGEPRLHWQGNVPVGFNAFYSHDAYGKARDMVDIAAYVAKNLRPLGYEFINMDGGFQPESYPQGMKTFTDNVHQLGLKAGGYLTPFAIYENWLDLPVDKTGYTHRDACLRDEHGQLIKTYLGSYALDMSHPAAQYIVRRNIRNYLDWGYDYIKLDFLDMGLYEGKHHDPSVNGMRNYRIGMKIMRDEVLASGRPVFLNASIAPLLPAAFTHGRRAACDTSLTVADYSGIERQAFNSAASWWSNGTLYEVNDADMFLPEHLLNGAAREGQRASQRLATTVALGGGHWLAGDNLPFVDEDRAAWLENTELLDVAKEGVAAHPVSMSNFYHGAEHSPSVLARSDGQGGAYVGLTNWGNKALHGQLSVHQLGLEKAREWQITELYSGVSARQKSDQVRYQLSAGDTAILHVSPRLHPVVTAANNLAAGKPVMPVERGFELDLGHVQRVNQLVISTAAPSAMRNFSISYQDGSVWHALARGFVPGDRRTFSFPALTTRRLRIEYESHEGAVITPQMAVYFHATDIPPMRIVQENIAPGAGRTDVQGQQLLMQTFTAEQSDLPKLDFWLFERYVDAVPGDNLRIRLVTLSKDNTPADTLFSAALPPFNLPATPAIYSLLPRLTGLEIGQRYAVIFSSQGSVTEPDGKNSYGIMAAAGNPYAGGELRHSTDGGKTWQSEPGQDALFTLYSNAAVKQGEKQ